MSLDRRLCVSLLVVVAFVLLACGAGAAAPARAATLPNHALWFDPLGPTTRIDRWVDVARGPDGALYAAGDFDLDFDTSGDVMVAKFSANDGAVTHREWADEWDNPAEHLKDQTAALAVDGTGALVVVGSTQTATFGREWLVAKWESGGARAWQKVFAASPLQAWDAGAYDVACDASGHIYVCGLVQTGASGGRVQASLVVRRLSGATGNVLWMGSYAGPVKGFNQGSKLALDSSGNAYVTGYGENAKHNSDIITCKFRATDGKRLWVHRIAGAKNLDDEGADVVVRGSSVWVTGGEYLSLKPHTRTVVLARYTTAGVRNWLRTWLEKTGTVEFTAAVAVDPHGNAVVAGAGNNNPVTRDHAFLVRWNAAGVRKWQRTTYNSASNKAGWKDVVCDAAGNIWAGGHVVTADGDTAFLVARYSAAGRRAWLSSWEGDESLGGECNALCLGTSGLFAGGEVTSTIAGDDAAALKYTR
jgi:hypothetical protein